MNYNELRVLIGHYGGKLATGHETMSYNDLMAALDRLVALRADVAKAWDRDKRR